MTDPAPTPQPTWVWKLLALLAGSELFAAILEIGSGRSGNLAGGIVLLVVAMVFAAMSLRMFLRRSSG